MLQTKNTIIVATVLFVLSSCIPDEEVIGNYIIKKLEDLDTSEAQITFNQDGVSETVLVHAGLSERASESGQAISSTISFYTNLADDPVASSTSGREFYLDHCWLAFGESSPKISDLEVGTYSITEKENSSNAFFILSNFSLCLKMVGGNGEDCIGGTHNGEGSITIESLEGDIISGRLSLTSTPPDPDDLFGDMRAQGSVEVIFKVQK